MIHHLFGCWWGGPGCASVQTTSLWAGWKQVAGAALPPQTGWARLCIPLGLARAQMRGSCALPQPRPLPFPHLLGIAGSINEQQRPCGHLSHAKKWVLSGGSASSPSPNLSCWQTTFMGRLIASHCLQLPSAQEGFTTYLHHGLSQKI